MEMKWFRGFLAIGLLLCVAQFVSAQNSASPSIYQQITLLADNYKGEKGVKSMVCNDGIRLQTVKMMLRKEFGKEFIDNIKAFAIVIYKDARRDVAERIVEDIETIATPLQQINIDDKIKPEAKARGFIRLSEDKTLLTDLLIISDAPAPKLIYFNGNFKPENIDYKK